MTTSTERLVLAGILISGLVAFWAKLAEATPAPAPAPPVNP